MQRFERVIMTAENSAQSFCALVTCACAFLEIDGVVHAHESVATHQTSDAMKLQRNYIQKQYLCLSQPSVSAIRMLDFRN